MQDVCILHIYCLYQVRVMILKTTCIHEITKNLLLATCYSTNADFNCSTELDINGDYRIFDPEISQNVTRLQKVCFENGKVNKEINKLGETE